MTGTISTRFFWADWMSDAGLRHSSLAARGLWMDMLCIAAEHSPRGYVAVKGKGLGADEIARLCGTDAATAKILIEELDGNGVFGRKRDGTIFSRRMIRDEKRAKILRKNGKNGGNPNLRKQKEISALVIQADKPLVHPLPIPIPLVNSEQASRPGAGGALADCKRRIVEAFVAAQERDPVNATPLIPETGRVDVWAAQGYDLTICAAVVVDGVARKNDVTALKYFDKAIVEAHEKRNKSNGTNGHAAAAPLTPEQREATQKSLYRVFVKTGKWHGLGPEPGHAGCEITDELLAKWKESRKVEV